MRREKRRASKVGDGFDPDSFAFFLYVLVVKS